MANGYRGRQILMDTLANEGVEYIVGNPGTTELPIMDSLPDYPQFQYILTLQEGVAVELADAYARASGKPAFVNLHVAPGLGNAIGHIYNAWEGHTPMVITAGQQDTRLRLREPMLGHDLAAMAAPVTKWSVQAESTDELALLLNRAFKVAQDTPAGPVFVSLPMNVLDGWSPNGALQPSHIFRRTAPDPEGLQEAAALLMQAKRPLILCGDGVTMAGANAELLALAEFLGANVWNEVLASHVNFPTGHACYRDRIGSDYAAIRKCVGDADTILLVGGEFFEEVWHEDVYPFPEDAVLIHSDPSPHNVGRNFPVRCGLTGDPKLVLSGLVDALTAQAKSDFQAAAKARMDEMATLKQQEAEKQQARAARSTESGRMSPARLMAELKAVLPEDGVVVSEAITASADLSRTLHFRNPGDYLGTWSGGIGQGMPMGVGMKLAQPKRPVVCISGDGSAMYTIQALWTAAYHKLPVIYIILSNRTYRILKINMNRYRERGGYGGERGYPHLDLNDPALGFADMARGMGVEGRTVERPEDFGAAFTEALNSGKPYLLDCLVDGGM